MSQRGFGFAGLLVLCGIVALLGNFGLLPPRYLAALWSLWPVVLLAAGANLALSRVRVWAGSLAFVLVLAAGFAAAGALAAADLTAGVTRESIAVTAGGATSARLTAAVGAGSLTLDAAAPPGMLVAGELVSGPGGKLDVRTTSNDAGRRTVALSAAAGWRSEASGWRFEAALPGWGAPHEWTLHLAPGVPAEVHVAGGGASIDLDLRELLVRDLEVEAGAADVRVALPAAAGRTQARFALGASSLRVTVPAGVAARIEVDEGLSSVRIDESRFPHRRGGVYASPDYERAANRVDIVIEAGASRVEVR